MKKILKSFINKLKGETYMNMGCNGGLPESAFTYAIDKGFVFESEYEYTARDGNCSTEAKFWPKKLIFRKDFFVFFYFLALVRTNNNPSSKLMVKSKNVCTFDQETSML